MRALKAKIAEGSDPRLLSRFKDKTLAHQVLIAGVHIYDDVTRNITPSNREVGTTISDVVSAPRFTDVVRPSWQQTMRYAASVFPGETRVTDLVKLLLYHATYGRHKSVEDRLRAVRQSA